MIILAKEKKGAIIDCNYVRCPVFNARLFDKLKGTKIKIIQHSHNQEHMDDTILIKCRKCGSKFFVSTCSDNR